MQTYDVAIVGGGMVGLSLALSLASHQFKVAVIEKNHAPVHIDEPTLRVSAFNLASETFFKQINVWHDIYTKTTAAYKTMYVWEKDSLGAIQFDCVSQGINHLGVIAENHTVQLALWEKAKKHKNIQLMENTTLSKVAFGENEVFVDTSNGMLMTKLIVAADGAHSVLREFADIPMTFWDYRHHALMARIKTKDPHQYEAKQVFSPDGVLAFLPQQDPYTSTIVWSTLPEKANELLMMDENAFNRNLNIAFDMRLGFCEVVSERKVFPLTARYAHHFAKERLVLLGDAAHTIHPLAGQGVNLGLMDCALLTEELVRLKKAGNDYGRHYYLGNYERIRKQQAAKMLLTMQGFHDLFAGHDPIKKGLRSLGLSMFNKIPAVKNQIMNQALGLTDMPKSLYDFYLKSLMN